MLLAMFHAFRKLLKYSNQKVSDNCNNLSPENPLLNAELQRHSLPFQGPATKVNDHLGSVKDEWSNAFDLEDPVIEMDLYPPPTNIVQGSHGFTYKPVEDQNHGGERHLHDSSSMAGNARGFQRTRNMRTKLEERTRNMGANLEEPMFEMDLYPPPRIEKIRYGCTTNVVEEENHGGIQLPQSIGNPEWTGSIGFRSKLMGVAMTNIMTDSGSFPENPSSVSAETQSSSSSPQHSSRKFLQGTPAVPLQYPIDTLPLYPLPTPKHSPTWREAESRLSSRDKDSFFEGFRPFPFPHMDSSSITPAERGGPTYVHSELTPPRGKGYSTKELQTLVSADSDPSYSAGVAAGDTSFGFWPPSYTSRGSISPGKQRSTNRDSIPSYKEKELYTKELRSLVPAESNLPSTCSTGSFGALEETDRLHIPSFNISHINAIASILEKAIEIRKGNATSPRATASIIETDASHESISINPSSLFMAKNLLRSNAADRVQHSTVDGHTETLAPLPRPLPQITAVLPAKPPVPPVLDSTIAVPSLGSKLNGTNLHQDSFLGRVLPVNLPQHIPLIGDASSAPPGASLMGEDLSPLTMLVANGTSPTQLPLSQTSNGNKPLPPPPADDEKPPPPPPPPTNVQKPPPPPPLNDKMPPPPPPLNDKMPPPSPPLNYKKPPPPPPPPPPTNDKTPQPPPPVNNHRIPSSPALNEKTPPPPPPPLPRRAERRSPSSSSNEKNLLSSSDAGLSVPPSEFKTTSTSSSESLAAPRSNSISQASKPPLSRPTNSNENGQLKALRWDKVQIDPSQSTVWEKLQKGSFELNEREVTVLFQNIAGNHQRKDVSNVTVPAVKKGIIGVKKSQNIAIQLKALNISMQDVHDALLAGDGLTSELLEILVKMSPTDEEKAALLAFDGNEEQLSVSERFLRFVLKTPDAFQRFEAMRFKSSFEEDLLHLNGALQAIKVACEEITESRLFLKLLEAVLKTGNRMNKGTSRGDAEAFKLDALLNLRDVKSADGKTTLLHFILERVIQSEGRKLNREANQFATSEVDCKRRGLEAVLKLCSELESVKRAAGIDSGELTSTLLKLESGIATIENRLMTSFQVSTGALASADVFRQKMEEFCFQANDEIGKVKHELNIVFDKVKQATAYFHGHQKETQPLKLLVIVKGFLHILEQVSKDLARSLRVNIHG